MAAESASSAMPDPSPAAGPGATPRPSAPAAVDPLTARLAAALARGTLSGEDLDALRRELLAAGPQAAIAAIVDFLRSGLDAATEQEFELGAGGTLAGAPTLRLFLIDLLGQLSKSTGSPAAAQLARQTLKTKTSADEWALSLRNVAWREPTTAAPFLAGKMREMLAHPAWRAEPSAGMLEAFDVIVFARDASFVGPLGEMLRTDPGPLGRASAVALDRLGEAAPLAVMQRLNSNPGEFADRPFLRADYFAKADLRDPAQRSAFETYLSRADVAAEEKTKALKGLATPASFVSPPESPNLLTASAPAEDPPERRAALDRALGEWAAANRFPEVTAQIEQVQRRLGR